MGSSNGFRREPRRDRGRERDRRPIEYSRVFCQSVRRRRQSEPGCRPTTRCEIAHRQQTTSGVRWGTQPLRTPHAMDDNTVMKPPSRSIRPPGAPTSIRPPRSTSIRPPRSGESFSTRHSFQSLRQPAPPSLWIFILVVALVIGIGTVAHLQDLADPSAPPTTIPARTLRRAPLPQTRLKQAALPRRPQPHHK